MGAIPNTSTDVSMAAPVLETDLDSTVDKEEVEDDGDAGLPRGPWREPLDPN